MFRFALTIFLHAFLLFQVQPLMGRYVLPWFGGTPSVWTMCMLFFQVMLLVGYAYAHLLSARLGRRNQVVLHVVLLLVSLALLPIGLDTSWKPVDSEAASGRILLMLLVSIGGPYVLLSSTGPLLQRWFNDTWPTRSPYRLYALSNLGSLLALISYPFVFEPALALQIQATSWSWIYVAFVVGGVWCGVAFYLKRGSAEGAAPEIAEGTGESAKRPSGRDVLMWMGLAALGSVMLLATTNQLCQDLAVMPFLWVLPLSLYLLTFVICFDHERWYAPGWYAIALAGVGVWTVLMMRQGAHAKLLLQIIPSALTMFVCCMVCHGQLVRTKPHARHLTTFYLAIAAGGAMGGLFVGLVAPVIFTVYWEYPIGLVAVLAVAMVAAATDRSWWLWRRSPLLATGVPAAMLGTVAVFVVLGAAFRPPGAGRSRGETLESTRNFYGVLRVRRVDADSEFDRLELEHGRITHGDQYLDSRKRNWPTTYYGHNSGAGIALSEHPRRHAVVESPGGSVESEGSRLRVGVVGLGTGTLAAHARPGDYFRFYEINADVLRLARKHFTYLADSKADHVDTVIGDARLMMEHEIARDERQAFDVLIVDAFSGDAIPIHLLTQQCGRIYFEHLKSDGVLAVHTSNRFVELIPIVCGIADAFDYKAVVIENRSDDSKHVDEAQWVLVTRSDAFLVRVKDYVKMTADQYAKSRSESDETEPPTHAIWSDEQPKPLLWTDDFSSLWQVLSW